MYNKAKAIEKKKTKKRKKLDNFATMFVKGEF